MAAVFEDVLILTAVFIATTAVAVIYALYQNKPKSGEKNPISLTLADFPRQTDTHLSPILLQSEQDVRSLEQAAMRILEGVYDEREKESG